MLPFPHGAMGVEQIALHITQGNSDFIDFVGILPNRRGDIWQPGCCGGFQIKPFYA